MENTARGIVSGDGYAEEDTVTVTEFWFRQPCGGESGGESYAAGDIALSVLIGGKEVKYMPKYWRKTALSSYPFVIYHKVPNENSLWGKSELEPIIGLIDAADRDLTFAQLNAAFHSNDVILAEENAFSDGEVPGQFAGCVVEVTSRHDGQGRAARQSFKHRRGFAFELCSLPKLNGADYRQL